jgi:hypothetical protein
MKLLIVIVSYRVTDLTIDCLRSLSGEIGRVPGARVALCENGTGGDAADRLRSAIEENGWSSWVELTVIYPNRGFTGGNNAVIRPALESDDPPEYVLLLNADTLVKEHALDTLVCPRESDHPFRGGVDGDQVRVRPGREASPALLVPGPAAVFLEASRGLVHSHGGRDIHPRVRHLAAAATDPAQAGRRPAAHALRLDPPQCLLRRIHGAGGREPGAARSRGARGRGCARRGVDVEPFVMKGRI